jgi:hypothetical protein
MQVPQTKVLERVSQILNGCGFFPTGGVIRIGSLYILHFFRFDSMIVVLYVNAFLVRC